jgi:hypothetical protein
MRDIENPVVSCKPTNEDELQAALAEVLRANDWLAIREYTPDFSDHRVDILAEHDTYGRVGIETKYLRTERQGARLGEAFLQVDRDYSRRRYNRDAVPLWVIAPFFSPGKLAGTTDDRRLMDFARSFLTRTGIGVLDCHAATLKMQFSTDDPRFIVPVAGPYCDTYAERLDLDELHNTVANRREERR